MKTITLSAIFFIASAVHAWSNIPAIPSNRRSQFYLRHDDGAYKYGYDSGDGIAAHQKSTGENQVEGFYSFPNEAGEIVKVKYTAGVQGFVPEGSEHSGQVQTRTQAKSWQEQHAQNVKLAQQQHQSQTTKNYQNHQAKISHEEETNANADKSYQISYNTGEHAREEKSDASGNVQGRYSYTDEAGTHDLTYISGPTTGFVVTGGSLSQANGLAGGQSTKSSFNQASRTFFNQAATTNFKSPESPWSSNAASRVAAAPNSDDASYNFHFDTEDHSRSEATDAAGNVQGRYSYTDEAGTHDLTYTAGATTGFVVTGGSLSKPNGLVTKQATSRSKKVWSTPVKKEKSFGLDGTQNYWATSPVKASVASNTEINRDTQNPNGSAYAFFYNADSHARQEEADESGNVRGGYAIRTGTGFEELQYEAGKDGFIVTGGSLAPKPPSWEDSSASQRGNFGTEEDFDPFPERGFLPNGQRRPLQIPNDHRAYNTDKSVQPTFTIVVPSNTQKSFEYGPKNALVLGFLPPKHDEKHGYIYDSSK